MLKVLPADERVDYLVGVEEDGSLLITTRCLDPGESLAVLDESEFGTWIRLHIRRATDP